MIISLADAKRIVHQNAESAIQTFMNSPEFLKKLSSSLEEFHIEIDGDRIILNEKLDDDYEREGSMYWYNLEVKVQVGNMEPDI